MKTPRTGEPRLAGAVSWLVLTASFGLSAATWVALAVLAGFDETFNVFGLVLRLAWLMPIAYDGYVVVALVMWMSPVPARVARFARTNTYAAAAIGVAAQSCFHALTIWTATGVVWRAALAAVVGALPPAVSGLAVHMRALVRRESVRPIGQPVAGAVPMPAPVAPSVHAGTPVVPAPARHITAPASDATPPSVPVPGTVPVPPVASPPTTAPPPVGTPVPTDPVAVVVNDPTALVADTALPAHMAANAVPVTVAKTAVPVAGAQTAIPGAVAAIGVPVASMAPRRRTTKRQPSAADRVAAAIGRSPKASDATIAARLGLSEATVKRHRRQAVDSVSAASDPATHAA